jgi:arginine deiminase
MANSIRISEAILMSYIFHYHPELCCQHFLMDASQQNLPAATFEGGDLLILRPDTMLIGMSERTNTQGIDYLLKQFKKAGTVKHIFVVILPKIRATIHLDMVFTMIDTDKAVVFPPLILAKNAVDVIQIGISSSRFPSFHHHDYLLIALEKVGIKLDPVYCGGKDKMHQEREQWQSGANFFTIAPGKVIGYGMNAFTFEALSEAGLPRLEAEDIINDRIDLDNYDSYAIAISGTELTRGGGGCRCMTMPVLREEI